MHTDYNPLSCMNIMLLWPLSTTNCCCCIGRLLLQAANSLSQPRLNIVLYSHNNTLLVFNSSTLYTPA